MIFLQLQHGQWIGRRPVKSQTRVEGSSRITNLQQSLGLDPKQIQLPGTRRLLELRQQRQSALVSGEVLRERNFQTLREHLSGAYAVAGPGKCPFQPLRLSWFIRSDLGTLTGAEIDGAPNALTGDALLSAYYVNELVLNLLHRHDPQPEIFDNYARTISALNGSDSLAATLRVFEIELLRLLGYALNLDFDAIDSELLSDESYYDYRVEQGPVQVSRAEGPMVFSGASLKSIQAMRFDDASVLRDAGRLLRQVIDHHLEGRELNSRKVLHELHRGKISRNP